MFRRKSIWTWALAVLLLLQHQHAASAAPAPAAPSPHQQQNASAPLTTAPAPAPSSSAKSTGPVMSPPPAKSTSPAASPPVSSPAASASPPSSGGTVAPSPAKSTVKAPPPAPPSSHGTNGTLDPAQIRALAALGVSAGSDPCSTAAHRNLICDQATPYRHLIYLQLQYCTENQVFPASAWDNLTTLQTLSFSECPAKQMTLPPELLDSVTTLQVVASLGRSVENVLAPGLTGVWLSKFHNLNQLTVQDVDVNASSVGFILNNITRLQQLIFSNTNLTGPLPKKWASPNLTSLEISGNDLEGGIPSSVTHLLQLTALDLSSCNLSGSIPTTMGNLSSLQTLKLGSNRLRGPIPASFQKLTLLQYLDLSDNQLNGSVPAYFAHLPGLRYVDLSKNNFRGEIPFNNTFLQSLNTFKAGGNAQLCYNSSIVSAKYVSGLQPCDSSGLPAQGSSGLSPSPAPAPQSHGPPQSAHNHGPKKIVLIVAVALAGIVAIIVFAIVLSRCCSSKH